MKYIWRFIVFLYYLIAVPLSLAICNILYFSWHLKFEQKWKDIFDFKMEVNHRMDNELHSSEKYIYTNVFYFLINKRTYYITEYKAGILKWVLDTKKNAKN